MPTLKFVRTRPDENTQYYNSNVSLSRLQERHSYTFIVNGIGLTRTVENTFTTRSALNDYLNDPERFANRDESNAYDAEHGIVTRVAVLDGNNSGSVKFNPITSTYDVTPMTEAEANAWVTEIAVA
jgi:hypothetical protein